MSMTSDPKECVIISLYNLQFVSLLSKIRTEKSHLNCADLSCFCPLFFKDFDTMSSVSPDFEANVVTGVSVGW